jgi:hypothetical protein
MKKLNPWRHGQFADCVAKLENAGLQRPKAFDILQEILDILDAVEAEDARLAANKKAAEAFRKRSN